jgi:hypothetical protein
VVGRWREKSRCRRMLGVSARIKRASPTMPRLRLEPPEVNNVYGGWPFPSTTQAPCNSVLPFSSCLPPQSLSLFSHPSTLPSPLPCIRLHVNLLNSVIESETRVKGAAVMVWGSLKRALGFGAREEQWGPLSSACLHASLRFTSNACGKPLSDRATGQSVRSSFLIPVSPQLPYIAEPLLTG